MDKDILNWDEIFLQIPESNNPEGMIHLIKTCLESNSYDPYEDIDKDLSQYIDNLSKSFREFNR